MHREYFPASHTGNLLSGTCELQMQRNSGLNSSHSPHIHVWKWFLRVHIRPSSEADMLPWSGRKHTGVFHNIKRQLHFIWGKLKYSFILQLVMTRQDNASSMKKKTIIIQRPDAQGYTCRYLHLTLTCEVLKCAKLCWSFLEVNVFSALEL